MRPYWTRLVAGIVLGCLCGATAALFIWAMGVLTSRLEKKPQASLQTCPNCGNTFLGTAIKEEKKVKPGLKLFPEMDDRVKQWGKAIDASLDPWLPRIERKLTWRQIVGGLFFLASIALIRGTTDYASNYCMGWVSERVVNDLRCDVLGKLTSLSLDYFNRSTTGDMLTRINADTVNLHRAMRQGTADLVKELFTMLGVFGYLMFMDWKLTLFVLVLIPIIIVPLFVLGKKARRASRETRKANVGQNSLLVEALTGIRVLKAFNLESHHLKRFRDFSKKLVHHGMKGVQ